MKKEDRRRVEFKNDHETGYPHKGFFHTYTEVGMQAEDNRTIIRQFALVEKEDGTMKVINPANMKFVDQTGWEDFELKQS